MWGSASNGNGKRGPDWRWVTTIAIGIAAYLAVQLISSISARSDQAVVQLAERGPQISALDERSKENKERSTANAAAIVNHKLRLVYHTALLILIADKVGAKVPDPKEFGLPDDIASRWMYEISNSDIEWAKSLVHRYCRKLPRYADRDELMGEALLSLVESSSRFDPSIGCTFRTFAQYRVQGSVVDVVRSLPWQEVPGVESLSAENTLDPSTVVVRSNLLGFVFRAMQKLPRRYNEVIRAHYFEGRTLAEIAETLGVTPARVSQIHSEAKRMIRSRLAERGVDPGTEPLEKLDTTCEGAYEMFQRGW